MPATDMPDSDMPDSDMPDSEIDEPARLLATADRYLAQAAAARELAAAIDQRRLSLTHRLEPCIQRHLPEVWSSAAAEISRMRLTRMIARDVWVSCEHLLETRAALMRRADELDSQALALTRTAAELSEAAALQGPKTTRDELA